MGEDLDVIEERPAGLGALPVDGLKVGGNLVEFDAAYACHGPIR